MTDYILLRCMPLIIMYDYLRKRGCLTPLVYELLQLQFLRIISTILNLITAIHLELRFKAKPLLNLGLVLGMFPGFMSMIAYFLLSHGLAQSLISLVLVYSGAGRYFVQGLLRLNSKSLNEANA